jgi:hypothetical protein
MAMAPRSLGRHNRRMKKLQIHLLPVFASIFLSLLVTAEVAAQMRSVALPAAPGSSAPNLEQADDGRLVLSWLEPDGDGHALRFSEFSDGEWQRPGTVSRGDNWFVNWADFPVVAAIDDGFWSAHWLVRRPAGGYAYDIYAAISTDNGASWSTPSPPHKDDTDTEHGFVSHYAAAGQAGLVWLDGRKTGGHAHGASTPAGMTLRTATLAADGKLANERELDALICDCCQTDVAMTSDGPVVVYRDRTADEVRDIYIARQIDGEWQQGHAVADDGWVIGGCPVNGPVVESRGQEVVVAWFTGADERPRVRLARSASASSGFSVPVDVLAEKALGRVGLVVLDDGSAIVSALQSSSPGRARLLLTKVSASGQLLGRITVADELPPFSVPQLARVADMLLVVYPTRDDSGQGISAVQVSLADFANAVTQTGGR